MNKIYYLLLITLPFAQQLDPVDVALDELRTVVETASRSNQPVFLDEITEIL